MNGGDSRLFGEELVAKSHLFTYKEGKIVVFVGAFNFYADFLNVTGFVCILRLNGRFANKANAVLFNLH